MYEIIKSNPIFQYERIAREEYERENAYPTFIIFDKNGLYEPRKIQYIEDESTKIIGLFLQKISENAPISDEDTVILFNRRVRGKNDIPLHYTPTPKDKIEPHLPVIPWNLSLLYRSNIPPFIKKSLYDLSEAEYFSNLVKNTPPQDIIKLSAYNLECDNILAQMFNKKITFNLINPETLEEYTVPIIDAEKLLLAKKNGILETNNLYEILDKNTLAITILDLYLTMKKSAPDYKINSLNMIISKGDLYIDYFIAKGDEIRRIHIPMEKDNYVTQKLCAFLEKTPLKTARISFRENVEKE